MKFSTILTAALAFTVTTVAATPTPGPFSNFDPFSIFGKDLGRGNKYGAPRKPWEGGKPGWYFGKHPGKVPRLPCLTGPICKILKLFPWFLQCPTPPPPNPGPSDGYTQTFNNHTGATQGNGYLTFGLVDTIADCKAMCNSVEGCVFANTYRDVNGKDGSPLLTCSLYSECHGIETATNTGGQSQPDGSINYIINSDGWCKA
ncbi:hypothetical protein CC1G_09148 [Coprinopsis cinerea okayama7|uniref:Apple domain-containing protein n=1 Tax=Coprinopsis cinerea (strain Okayama-7 / 130 / ATCC MYA-4618 / FGSC 9003) TaxID=240176 RepID=A8P9Q5_COPC7|nr:hypothetical protein CC1G_09148 [Coprinopsis cinerea okayama7\|eukprot:XP_001839814.1 hypothetical protein CC1G_09148 [Coprinopsis cinerea okayama7\